MLCSYFSKNLFLVFGKLITNFLIIFSLHAFAQEVPPINIFTSQDYGAEDQNWAITQGSDDFIYVANNAGLLEYNGAVWNLYKSPKDVILRSVRSVKNRVYTGGYMEFGYWERNTYGELIYTSLSADNELSIIEDEEFWGIIDLEEYILFQSFDRIYIFNTRTKRFRIINSENRINKIFEVDGAVYFQKRSSGLFKIVNGRDSLFLSAEALNNIEIINIFSKGDDLLIVSKEAGFFLLSNKTLSKYELPFDNKLFNESIYSSIQLKNGSYALGTISDGLILIDKDGNLLQTINQSLGLSNNTVLAIYEDKYGNAWLGLDNGINAINFNSPYAVYKDKLGILGTVYVTELIGDTLYLGTNQGLFYKALNSNDGFSFVKGTDGQVWTLEQVNGQLLCGHDKGTFIVFGDKALLVSDDLGTWNIQTIESNSDLLLTGNYKGLYVLKKSNGSWKKRNKIEGFDISSRYCEFISKNEVLISHEYKGIYKLVLDEDYRTVLRTDQISGMTGSKSSITSFNDDVLYCNQSGVFRYNVETNNFDKDTLFTSYLANDKYLSGKLVYNKDENQLWGFPKNEIVLIEPGKLSEVPEIEVIPIPNDIRKGKPGYDNILSISDQRYLIGTTEGYLIIDREKFKETPLEIQLNHVAYNSKHNKFVSLALDENVTLETKDNSLKLNFSITNFNALSSTQYQYRLLGIYDNWSGWSSRSEQFFDNLPHGEYLFEVRGKSDGQLSNNTATYFFKISKPWYAKPLAIVFYFVLGFLIVLSIHYFNRRYYKKQKEKLLEKKAKELELEQLENQRQLIQFKNKNLQLDIENKNRELGMATMNLVKRNELLNNIKDQLTKSSSIDDVKTVIRQINTSLNSTSDWKLFEEAFNNVDKDFMKKIKSLHPEITPNDLRLCAYLRLNLSSKEIAPLLNISHKSVEVKRYRLRKKMGLGHNQSLSNYIIEL